MLHQAEIGQLPRPDRQGLPGGKGKNTHITGQNDRCERICGKNPNSKCFMLNDKHMACLSDLIINDLWGIRELVRMSQNENKCEHLSELLDMTYEKTNKLIVWIKTLQEEAKKKKTGDLSSQCVARYIQLTDTIECGTPDKEWTRKEDILPEFIKEHMRNVGQCDNCLSLQRAMRRKTK